MIKHIKIDPPTGLTFTPRKGFSAEKVEEASNRASEIASQFHRIASILDAIYHNPNKKTIPSIMQDHALGGDVLVIEPSRGNQRTYKLGLLTITEEETPWQKTS